MNEKREKRNWKEMEVVHVCQSEIENSFIKKREIHCSKRRSSKNASIKVPSCRDFCFFFRGFHSLLDIPFAGFSFTL